MKSRAEQHQGGEGQPALATFQSPAMLRDDRAQESAQGCAAGGAADRGSASAQDRQFTGS